MENAKTQALREQIAALVQEYAAIALKPQAFLPGATVVPPSGKQLDARELQFMVEASLDGWLTTGRFNAEFEKKLAAFIGVKHLITVNSGSSANLVAFALLREGSKESLNVHGAYLEVLSDTIGSVGVIVGAGVMAVTGWTWVDPVVGVGIGLWILPRTYQLGAQALRILVCHHPLLEMIGGPMTGRVWGGPAAAQRFAQAGVDLVLTGHIHAPFAWPYPFGDARTYGIGAGTLSLRERGVPPGFNLIEADETQVRITALAFERTAYRPYRTWALDRRT